MPKITLTDVSTFALINSGLTILLEPVWMVVITMASLQIILQINAWINAHNFRICMASKVHLYASYHAPTQIITQTQYQDYV